MSFVGYELATPDVVAEKFQEGFVVLNLKSGQYFDVGGRAAALIAAFEEKVSLDQIVDALEEAGEHGGNQAKEAVAQLLELGLVREVCRGEANTDSSAISAVITSEPDYRIDCHNDLADLIAADPIHDLDPETGKLL